MVESFMRGSWFGCCSVGNHCGCSANHAFFSRAERVCREFAGPCYTAANLQGFTRFGDAEAYLQDGQFTGPGYTSANL
jgi:hypothetical protein